MTTTNVENWPGDPVGIQGLDLMQHLLQHAERFNTKLVSDPIHTAKLDEKPMRLVEDAGEYTCDSLIIATGVSAQYLGLPSEEALRRQGVSDRATCDGFFYQGQDVAVVGGSNIAVEEALYRVSACSAGKVDWPVANQYPGLEDWLCRPHETCGPCRCESAHTRCVRQG